jgi:hypothetical protein
MAWKFNTAPCDTGAQSNVNSSASSVEILAADKNRNGFTLYNDSTAILYLLLSDGTASTTVYTTQVAANGGFFEAPYNYRGAVNGIWAVANGAARVTEFK